MLLVWPLGVIQTCLLCPFPFTCVTTPHFLRGHTRVTVCFSSLSWNLSSPRGDLRPLSFPFYPFLSDLQGSESNSIRLLTSPSLPPLLPDHPEFQTPASSFPPNVSSSCMFPSHSLRPVLSPASRVTFLKHVWWPEGDQSSPV